ncbi:MAG: porin [Vicinamibacteria bacterium]
MGTGTSRMMVRVTAVAAVLSALSTAAGFAQDAPEWAAVHGFGGDAYGKTGDNRYLVGSPTGEYQNAQLALAVLASPSEKLQISSQVSWKQTSDGVETDLDYAFAEWKFSDAVRLRAGRAKQPFGIYTEIFDVGTLRPFYSLPQGVYGPAALVAKGYDGLGITGRANLSDRWALRYDLYGGGVRLASTELAPGLDEGEGATESVEIIRDAVGGRVIVETPVRGLHLGLSAYSGKEEREEQVRHNVYGVQGEYLGGGWSARSEYVWHPEKDGPHLRAFYLEVARTFHGHWQPAARFDWSDTTFSSGEPLPANSLGQHRDIGVGFNYIFAPAFVLKTSFHDVNGNRFARPDDLEAVLDAGALQTRTHLVVVGAQFSF